MNGTIPVVDRVYTLTPTNQGPATVTLFYLTQDLIDYNNNLMDSAYQKLAIPNQPYFGGEKINNAIIDKYSGGGFGIGTFDLSIPVTLEYNNDIKAWKAIFNVNSFSTFYLKSANAPLSTNGLVLNCATNTLSWQDLSTNENTIYTIEKLNNSTNKFVSVYKLNGLITSQTYKVENTFGDGTFRVLKLQNNKTIISNTCFVKGKNLASINVYPNPAKDLLYIDFTDNKFNRISILDATGKEVYKADINESTSININQLNSGLYTVKLFGEGLQVTRLIAIQ